MTAGAWYDDAMPRHSLLSELQKMAEPAYRDFAARLIPGETRLLGVRIPKLRKLAKQLVKGDTWQTLLQSPAPQDASFEELLLRAMLPAYAPHATTDERLFYLRQEQPRLNNWSLCDSACAGCHFVRSHKEKVFLWLQPFLHSEQEFTARFGVVMLNNYYATDDSWVPDVIRALQEVPQEAYYASMAVAWCGCTLLTSHIDRHADIGHELLTPGFLPAHTHRLLLKKLRESQKKWSDNQIYSA